MVWLYKLPNSCIVLLFGVIGAALFVGVLLLRVKLLRFQVQSDHAKAAHDALTRRDRLCRLNSSLLTRARTKQRPKPRSTDRDRGQ